VTGSTFRLLDSTGAQVPATVTYNPTTLTATSTPNAPLAYASSYTPAITGGLSGVLDTTGNPMRSGVLWLFTAEPPPPGTCPCSIWSSSTTPEVANTADTAAVTLGVRFRSDVNGHISGIRFYKGALNTGTHVGQLWSSTGTLLASATFTNETASGWQQVTFAPPVAITAGTTYVAAYFAPNGRYSLNAGYFSATGVDNFSLHALRDGVDGPNGVFTYGNAPAFPVSTFGSGNYWVDVVFTPGN
jgi:hypothetical protein